MARVYDNTDLLWTTHGDYYIGRDNDLMDTSFDPLRSLVQEVRTRIMSDQGDWVNDPSIGGNISDFVGKMNNKPTAEGLKVRIIGCLTRDNFIHPQDLKVMYLPVDRDRIMFRLSVRVAATAKNVGSTTIGINFLYDYTENNILFK